MRAEGNRAVSLRPQLKLMKDTKRSARPTERTIEKKDPRMEPRGRGKNRRVPEERGKSKEDLLLTPEGPSGDRKAGDVSLQDLDACDRFWGRGQKMTLLKRHSVSKARGRSRRSKPKVWRKGTQSHTGGGKDSGLGRGHRQHPIREF